MTIRTIAVLVLLGCGSEAASEPEPSAGAETPSEAATPESGDETPFGLMNGANPIDGVYTSGQPTVANLEAAYAAGVRTVISLRAEDEPGQEEELATIERLGMRFERLTVRPPEDVTADNAQALEALMADVSNDGETLVHCGSSNRVGALMAFREFYIMRGTLEESIEAGRAAGLTRLEAHVRAYLEQTCADAPGDARCPSQSTP